MKTIKREAKVGERILIVDANSPLGTYINGDIFTVVVSKEIGVDVSGHGTHIFHEEYEVIVEEEKRMTGDIEARYVKLHEDLTKAVEELRQLALEVRSGISEIKPTPPTAGEIAKHCREVAQEHIQRMTPQQKRDAIVEQAKNDIEDLKISKYNFYVVPNEMEPSFPYYCNAEFIVNAEKRTVVALLRGHSSGIIRAKGIAKCAPTDCFNSHIGKAISLRRALGLEVPAEYLNAPQPTEVRDYDIIKLPNGRVLTVTPSVHYDKSIEGEQCQRTSPSAKKGRIIDDTREGVDGE